MATPTEFSGSSPLENHSDLEIYLLPDSLVSFDTTIQNTLTRLEADRIVPRIWDRDHTVWNPEPTEIDNRLGWLDVPNQMLSQISEFDRIREDVLATGYEDVVLLGMGGSSLGAEALVRCIGATPGHPRLHVLDSTQPDWVRSVRNEIDPSHTLFIAASNRAVP